MIKCNVGREKVRLTVTNLADRPIQVRSLFGGVYLEVAATIYAMPHGFDQWVRLDGANSLNNRI